MVDVKITNIKSDNTANKHSSFDFKLANYDHINSFLANINWFLLFSSLANVEDVWNVLIVAFLNKAIICMYHSLKLRQHMVFLNIYED